MRAAPGDPVQSADQRRSTGRGSSSRWNRERTTAGRRRGSSASSAARTAAENRARRLHDEVDHEGPATEPQLGPLPVEVGDGLLDLADRALPDAAAAVQHPVDGGLAEAGLDRRSRGSGTGASRPYSDEGFLTVVLKGR